MRAGPCVFKYVHALYVHVRVCLRDQVMHEPSIYIHIHACQSKQKETTIVAPEKPLEAAPAGAVYIALDTSEHTSITHINHTHQSHINHTSNTNLGDA